MIGAEELERVRAGAERLARARIVPELRLGTPRVLKHGPRSLVLRCDVAPAGAAPPSLVVKHIGEEPARGYSDWASLAFLTRTGRGVAPAFLAGDAGTGTYLIEDLGPGRSLAELLDARDAPAVLRALCALGDTMGRLVAATYESEVPYRELRETLPAARDTGRAEELARWRAALSRVEGWREAAGVGRPPGLDAGLEAVARAFAEPGPWLAFSHGDPAPSNNHVSPEGVRLLDFEYGDSRHALYDLSGWYVLCPLPSGWVAELAAGFRRALEPIGGVFGDEPAWREAWGAICAYRALAMLGWFPRRALHEDRPWVERWSVREAVLSTAHRLHAACADVPRLTALARLGEELARRLGRRWPELGDGRVRWAAASSSVAGLPTSPRSA
jgi:hypothetical protein